MQKRGKYVQTIESTSTNGTKKHYEVAFEFLFGPDIKSNQQKHLKMAILRFQ